MELRSSVHIDADPEQVWKVFTDADSWEDWYGVPVYFSKEGGAITAVTFRAHDGILQSSSPVKDYAEGASMTVVGTFGNDIYTVEPEGSGCRFSQRSVFMPGMSMAPSAQMAEEQKRRKCLERLGELVKDQSSASGDEAQPKASKPIPHCAKCGFAYTKGDVTLHESMVSADTKIIDVRMPAMRDLLGLCSLIKCPGCGKAICTVCAKTDSGYKCPECGTSIAYPTLIEPKTDIIDPDWDPEILPGGKRAEKKTEAGNSTDQASDRAENKQAAETSGNTAGSAAAPGTKPDEESDYNFKGLYDHPPKKEKKPEEKTLFERLKDFFW